MSEPRETTDHGDRKDRPTANPNWKDCPGCGRNRALSNFPLYARHRHAKPRRSPFCNDCTTARKRARFLNGDIR